LNLRAKIGGGVEETPLTRNCAPSELSLRTRITQEAAIAQPTAVCAGTVPLRKTTTRSAAQYLYSHCEGSRLQPRGDDFRSYNERYSRAIGDLRQLAVAVRVDFAAKANFFNLRSFPFHRSPLLVASCYWRI
jgi:hypothetical protein